MHQTIFNRRGKPKTRTLRLQPRQQWRKSIVCHMPPQSTQPWCSTVRDPPTRNGPDSTHHLCLSCTTPRTACLLISGFAFDQRRLAPKSEAADKEYSNPFAMGKCGMLPDTCGNGSKRSCTKREDARQKRGSRDAHIRQRQVQKCSGRSLPIHSTRHAHTERSS